MIDRKSVGLLFRFLAILRCVFRRLFAEVSIECSAGIFKVHVVFSDSPMEENVGEKTPTVQCSIPEDLNRRHEGCGKGVCRKLATS
jgi:hypothetical protein